MILIWNSADMCVQCSVIDDNDQRHDFEWQAGRDLARDMLGFLRDTLAKHDATFKDIEAIAVFRGPGSYTGLRIGMTVLNTLAAAQAVPIVGGVGDSWEVDCLTRLARGENDKVVLPEYGGDAHTTKPRK